MNTDIENFVKSCICCTATSQPYKPPQIQPTITPSKPWEVMHMDLCGPFPNGNVILALIDEYSRWPEVNVFDGNILNFVCPRLSKIAFQHPRRSNQQQELSHIMEARNSVKETWVRSRACRAGVCVCGGGVTPTHLIYLKFVGILTKCVGKISSSNVVGKFGVFIIKNEMQYSINNPVPQKSNFYRR